MIDNRKLFREFKYYIQLYYLSNSNELIHKFILSKIANEDNEKKYCKDFEVINREQKVDKGLQGWVYHPAIYTYRHKLTGEERTDYGEINQHYIIGIPKY